MKLFLIFSLFIPFSAFSYFDCEREKSFYNYKKKEFSLAKNEVNKFENERQKTFKSKKSKWNETLEAKKTNAKVEEAFSNWETKIYVWWHTTPEGKKAKKYWDKKEQNINAFVNLSGVFKNDPEYLRIINKWPQNIKKAWRELRSAMDVYFNARDLWEKTPEGKELKDKDTKAFSKVRKAMYKVRKIDEEMKKTHDELKECEKFLKEYQKRKRHK